MKMATAKKRPDRRKTSVHWTEEEQARIAAETFRVLASDTKLSKIEGVNVAMRNIAPPERWRSLDEWFKVKEWLKLPPELEAQFHPNGKRRPDAVVVQLGAPAAAIEFIAPPKTPEITPADILVVPKGGSSKYKGQKGQPPQLAASGAKRKDGMRKVFWKEHEQTQLVQAAAMALHQGLTKSVVEALNLAQTELPAERQRHIISVTSMPWYRPGVAKALEDIRKAQARLDLLASKEAERKALQEAAAMVDEPDVASEVNFTLNDPEQHAQAVQATPAAPTPVAAPTPATLPTLNISDGLSLTLGALRSVLVTELASIFREALVLAVRGTAGEVAGTPTEPPRPSPDQMRLPEARNGTANVIPKHDPYGSLNFQRMERKDRKRVVVAGLRIAEAQVIDAEFGDKLDMRFYNTDKSKSELQAMLGSCDVALAITDGRISHNHTDMMKARAKEKYVPVAGGMMNVRDKLRTIISGVHLKLSPLPTTAQH